MAATGRKKKPVKKPNPSIKVAKNTPDKKPVTKRKKKKVA
jgi:hypothetical protein